MSECLSLPEIPLPNIPDFILAVPSPPSLSFGGDDFCCLVKIPNIVLLPSINLPPAITLTAAPILQGIMEIMDVYYDSIAVLPKCPME